MAGIVRKTDMCSGHGGFPPRLPTSWSSNVYANGLEVVRVPDSWASHSDDAPSTHSGTSSSGSATVFANGLPMCRIGDSVSCGSTMPNGSTNVFAG